MENKKTFINKARSFLTECKRVLQITKKPTTEELKTIVKITGLGMIIIGFIGFLINMVKEAVI